MKTAKDLLVRAERVDMIECAASARFSQTFLNLTETYPKEFITLDEEELVLCGPAYKRQEF